MAPTHAAYLDLPTRTCDHHASSHRRPKKDDPKTAPNLEYDVIKNHLQKIAAMMGHYLS